jgi:hypothetical protein
MRVAVLLDDVTAVPGTILLYLGTARLAKRSSCLEPLSRIGDYEAMPDLNGERPESTDLQRVQRWASQVVHWLACALFARIVETFVILLPLLEQLVLAANALGWWACSKAEVEAKQWLNLMVAPLLLDAGQFTVQNFVLKGATR